MIHDKGKLFVTLLLIGGLLIIIAAGMLTGHDQTQAWAVLGGIVGYVFANGKQLVSPSVPSPMIVPTVAGAAALMERQVAHVKTLEDTGQPAAPGNAEGP